MSDEERSRITFLKQRVYNSDIAAFKELFEYYYARLLNYAFVIIKNHGTAEDIVLEVMEQLWTKRSAILTIDNLTSYLYVCIKNRILDFLKKNSRLIHSPLGEKHYEEYITIRNPESNYLTEELIEVINNAILNLPEKARLVYRLVKEDGLSHKEVSEVLDISMKTVNNHIFRAMREIRLIVKKYLETGNSTATMFVSK